MSKDKSYGNIEGWGNGRPPVKFDIDHFERAVRDAVNKAEILDTYLITSGNKALPQTPAEKAESGIADARASRMGGGASSGNVDPATGQVWGKSVR